jgi:hypothetical protein
VRLRLSQALELAATMHELLNEHAKAVGAWQQVSAILKVAVGTADARYLHSMQQQARICRSWVVGSALNPPPLAMDGRASAPLAAAALNLSAQATMAAMG